MACACSACQNRRLYYLWLLDTVEEFGGEIPKVLRFDPYAASNTRLDSAINRLLKLYRSAVEVYLSRPSDDESRVPSLLQWPFDIRRSAS